MSRRRPALVGSGGQTGVDRAALDAAIALGIPHFGWCPRGRRAEDGRVPDRYALIEAPSEAYRMRTELNVEWTDATLVLTFGQPEGGSAFTVDCARRLGKPWLHVDLGIGPKASQARRIRAWMRANSVESLNVAGSRESRRPGIYGVAKALLETAWR